MAAVSFLHNWLLPGAKYTAVASEDRRHRSWDRGKQGSSIENENSPFNDANTDHGDEGNQDDLSSMETMQPVSQALTKAHGNIKRLLIFLCACMACLLSGAVVGYMSRADGKPITTNSVFGNEYNKYIIIIIRLSQPLLAIGD